MPDCRPGEAGQIILGRRDYEDHRVDDCGYLFGKNGWIKWYRTEKRPIYREWESSLFVQEQPLEIAGRRDLTLTSIRQLMWVLHAKVRVVFARIQL